MAFSDVAMVDLALEIRSEWHKTYDSTHNAVQWQTICLFCDNTHFIYFNKQISKNVYLVVAAVNIDSFTRAELIRTIVSVQDNLN